MKLLMSIDFYLWNHWIPKMNEDFFKQRLNSIVVIMYISLFNLPRKFVLNYIYGKGKSMVIDTKKLITQNNEVLTSLKHSVQQSIKRGQANGAIDICQTEIYNPNYKYSLGSLTINYTLNGEIVKLSIWSRYRFQNSPERITRHLHHWLFALKEKGKTADFDVIGNDWIIRTNQLLSLEAKKQYPNQPRLKVLV